MIKYFDEAGDAIAFQIAKILYRARVSALAVTLLRFALAAPASWYFFSKGEYIFNVIGLIVYVTLAFLDIVDGDLALLYKLPLKTKQFGKLMDHTLDRILLLIVLGSFFYAGIIKSTHRDIWAILMLLYYSNFFFLSAQMYEFDRIFQLTIETYPEIEKKIQKSGRSYTIPDKILFNLLYVHNNTVTRIFLTQNFLLVIGILTNQLLAVFTLITTMTFLRSAGVFILESRTLSMQPTSSILIETLRKYKV